MASSNDSSRDAACAPTISHSDANVDISDLASIQETWVQLAKGEKTAQALECSLSKMEKKLDDLLAGLEQGAHAKVEGLAKPDHKEEMSGKEAR